MGRSRDAVQIDKYALDNVILANETTAKEVSQLLGHAGNFIANVKLNGGYMKRKDYENLKGLLRVTDSDIAKAVPVQRHEEVENIYSAYPVKKDKNVFTLDEENQQFIDKLSAFCGGEKAKIINAIVREYRQTSALAQTFNAAIDAVKKLTE